MLPDWQRLFPDADYRFQMAVRPGDADRFWKPPPGAPAILAERRRWLAETPARFVAHVPEGAACVGEALDYLSRFHASEPDARDAAPPAHDDLTRRMIALSGGIEADWVVLSPDAGRDFPIVAGVVVFPSSWDLREKIGRPIHEVHEPAPGLNASLGRSISTFLDRIQPGAAWERENWGLSADSRLNHHPVLPCARLDATARPCATWLRLERQILQRLPRTGAILFGIHVSNHRLDTLAAIPGLAPRLARALHTMPEDIARYKGLASARDALAAALAPATGESA